jgi:hypothetical protein
MTGGRFTQIGIDRTIRLEWLEKTAALVQAGNEAKTIKTTFQHDFTGAFLSTKTDMRGAMDKTITILLKTWLNVPAELESLRVGGLELLATVPRSHHLALHWGMVMAVYPFWAGVATQVGRLLRLQGYFTGAHVQRRIREQYGQRETVSGAASRMLRSYIEWGVLRKSNENGIYSAGPCLVSEDSRLIAWLMEAVLNTRVNRSAPLKELLDSPGLFPFRFTPVHADSLLAASSKIDILRHGLDDELVILT